MIRRVLRWSAAVLGVGLGIVLIAGGAIEAGAAILVATIFAASGALQPKQAAAPAPDDPTTLALAMHFQDGDTTVRVGTIYRDDAWETRVVGGPLDGTLKQYPTLEAALIGHHAICQRVMATRH